MPTSPRIVKTVPRRGYCSVPSRRRIHPPVTRRLAPARHRFCRTKDGVQAGDDGDGQGLPLVRPPTWFNHLEYEWHVQFRNALYRFLAERCHLVRYDGRGNGLSDRYVPEISFSTFGLIWRPSSTRWVCSAMRCSASRRAHRSPSHTRYATPSGCASSCSTVGWLWAATSAARRNDRETAQAYLTLMRHGWGDEHSAFLRTFGMLYFPSASADELRALAQLQRMAMSGRGGHSVRQVTADIDIVDLLPKVPAPTLMLHSRHDNAVPFEEGRASPRRSQRQVRRPRVREPRTDAGRAGMGDVHRRDRSVPARVTSARAEVGELQ